MSTGVVSVQNNKLRKFPEENMRNCAYEVVMPVNPYLHPHTLEKLWKQFYGILCLGILLTLTLTRWIFVKIRPQLRELHTNTFVRSDANVDDNRLSVFHSRKLVYRKLSGKFKTYFMSNSLFFHKSYACTRSLKITGWTCQKVYVTDTLRSSF
jgi:hypothetical protein